MKSLSNNLQGVIFVVLGLLIFSLQDIAVKWIGGSYSIMEIVLIRSLVALPITLILFRLEGKRGLPKTANLKLESVRGVFLFLSYTTHFMGLAALPLADIAAIRFSIPLMITVLSVLWLGEKVGWQRWLALMIGFIGVLLIVQPGAAGFNLGSLFILLSALFYALAVILTRQLRNSDSSATMAYFSSLVYIVAAVILSPLAIFIGESPNAHPSIVFLLRAWTMPTLTDLLIMCGFGLIWAGGMYCSARAYSLARASVIAPFEYATLPINLMWGIVLWHEFPILTTWIGGALTIFSGLFSLYRERQEQRKQPIHNP